MPSMRAVFHVHGVSKIYRMGEVEVHALRGVDLELYSGELVVLLGASGSGKSTVLNILGRLDTPTAGEVYYLDSRPRPCLGRAKLGTLWCSRTDAPGGARFGLASAVLSKRRCSTGCAPTTR